MSYNQGYRKERKKKGRKKKNYNDWYCPSIPSENAIHGNDPWKSPSDDLSSNSWDWSNSDSIENSEKFSNDFSPTGELKNLNTSDVWDWSDFGDTIAQSQSEVKQKVDPENEKNYTSIDSDSNACREIDPVHDALNNLSTDFLSALRKNLFTDVSVKCGDYVQQVHKFVLAARSPVFESMFSTAMEESEKGVVTISDIDASVLDDLLAFIYGAQIENMTLSKACDLLYVAEKYQIKALKEICTNYLKSCLSIPNAIQILQFADLYDEELKEEVLSYVCKNFTVLKTTEEWRTLQSQRPNLSIDVYSLVVEKYEQREVAW